MSSKFKESPIKKEIMQGEDYEIYPRKLAKNQKNFKDLIFGDNKIIESVWIDNYKSFRPTEGWICFNVKTKMYKVIPNLSINKMYTDACSDASYFGMDYVSKDYPIKKLDLISFKKEFLLEVEKKYNKRSGPYFDDEYKKYLETVNKYVQNVSTNLSIFKALDSGLFNSEVNRIVSKYNFKKINNISSYKNCLYLVVLDEYKQFYVGKSETSLKNRMRKHWTAKIIPGRHLWTGDFEYSRIKFDTFKMLDCSRIYVSDDISLIINENICEATDPRIEITNTFGIEKFDEMNDLAKAERIVINNCKCAYCLSDRTPLLDFSVYNVLEKIYKVSRYDLLIKNYLRLDEKKPFEARINQKF